MINSLPLDARLKLPGWKHQHGEVFFIPEVGGKGLVLRNFTLGEHEHYLLELQVDKGLADENLVKKCIIWPEDLDLDELPGSIVSVILNKLNEVSPYDNPQRFIEKLEEQRAEVNTPKGQIYAYIAAAFPSMKLFDIQELNFFYVAKHIALAEKILGQSFQISQKGELEAAPQTNLSPAQIQQRHKLEKLRARRERSGQTLNERRLSELGKSSPEQTPSSAGSTKYNLSDETDDMTAALREAGLWKPPEPPDEHPDIPDTNSLDG